MRKGQQVRRKFKSCARDKKFVGKKYRRADIELTFYNIDYDNMHYYYYCGGGGLAALAPHSTTRIGVARTHTMARDDSDAQRDGLLQYVYGGGWGGIASFTTYS